MAEAEALAKKGREGEEERKGEVDPRAPSRVQAEAANATKPAAELTATAALAAGEEEEEEAAAEPPLSAAESALVTEACEQLAGLTAGAADGDPLPARFRDYYELLRHHGFVLRLEAEQRRWVPNLLLACDSELRVFEGYDDEVEYPNIIIRTRTPQVI